MSKIFNPINGWILIDKKEGDNSTFVVSKIKKYFNVRRVGHAGTLDPFATGLLCVALGKATKTIPYMQEKEKIYQFELFFGHETDTQDKTGEILEKSSFIPKEIDIKNILKKFTGEIEQIPPKYSALKINGKRAYELARKGVEFEIKSRKINVKNIKLNEISKNIAKFEVICSKGTYVRTLGVDIARELGSRGHLISLRRKNIGNFSVNNAFLLENIINKVQNHHEFEKYIIDVGAPLYGITVVDIDDVLSFKFLNGVTIDKIVNNINSSDKVVVFNKEELLGIGSYCYKKIKPIKILKV